MKNDIFDQMVDAKGGSIDFDFDSMAEGKAKVSFDDMVGGKAPGYSFTYDKKSEPYRTAIESAESKYGIPKNLIANQIQAESSFNPEAKSPAGAVGISQIVPKWHPDVDPSDPISSIDYQAKLMKKHFDRFGTWDKALAAYNMGPENLKKYGVRGLEETRNYLDKINKGKVEPTPPAQVITEVDPPEAIPDGQRVSTQITDSSMRAPVFGTIANMVGTQIGTSEPPEGWDELGRPLYEGDKEDIEVQREPYGIYEGKFEYNFIQRGFKKLADLLGVEAELRLSEAAKAQDIIRLGAIEEGIPLHEYRQSPELIEQAASAFTSMASFGMMPALRSSLTGEVDFQPTDPTGYIGHALGSLGGLVFGPIKASEKILAPVLKFVPRATQEGRVSVRVLKEALHDSIVLGPALGLAQLGEAAKSVTFSQAAEHIWEGTKSGALTGAIFGASRGLFPAEGAERATRIATGLIGLNALRAVETGSNPFTDRPVENVVFDVLLDTLFLWKGLPKGSFDHAVKRIEYFSKEASNIKTKEDIIKTMPEDSMKRAQEEIIKAEKNQFDLDSAEFTKRVGGDAAIAEEMARQVEEIAKAKLRPIAYTGLKKPSEAKVRAVMETLPEGAQPNFTYTSAKGNEYVKVGEQWYKDGKPVTNTFVIKAAEQKKVEARKTPIEYNLDTEDAGKFDVGVLHHKDGSITIFDRSDISPPIDYKADFARGKSDIEMIKYALKPLGIKEIKAAEQKKVEAEEFVDDRLDIEKPEPIAEVDEQIGTEFVESGRAFNQSLEEAEAFKGLYEDRKSVMEDLELFTQKMVNDANLWAHGQDIPIEKVRDGLTNLAARADGLRSEFLTGRDHEAWKEVVGKAAEWARKLEKVGEVKDRLKIEPTIKKPALKELSFSELSRKSDDIQKQIDLRHDKLEETGVKWEDQEKDIKLSNLYDKRNEYDTAAAVKGYEGAKQIIINELGKDIPTKTLYASVDSILREHYSLIKDPTTGSYMMSKYTGKDLSDAKGTIKKTGLDISKLLLAKDVPQADYWLTMESPISGITRKGKEGYIKDGLEKAGKIHKEITDFFMGDKRPDRLKIEPTGEGKKDVPDGTKLYSGIPVDEVKKLYKNIKAKVTKHGKSKLTPEEKSLYMAGEWNESFENARNAKKFDLKRFLDRAGLHTGRAIHERRGRLRRQLIKQYGAKGHKILQYIDAGDAADGRADRMYHEMRKEAFKGVPSKLTTQVDAVDLIKRLKDIYGYKTASQFKPPKGMGPTQTAAIDQLISFFRGMTPEERILADKASKVMSDHVKLWVDDMVRAGLKSKEEGEALKSHDYRKIRSFKIERMYDQRYKIRVGDKVVRQSDSGVDPLGKEAISMIETDSRILYKETADRIYRRVSNQETKLQWKEFDAEHADNPFVIFKDNDKVLERSERKAPKNWVKDYWYDNGKQKVMYYHPDVALQLLASGSHISYPLSRLLTFGLGIDLTRALTVGTSAVWATTKGITMDLGHTFFSAKSFDSKTGKPKRTYSKFAPVYLGQIGRDMKNTFYDAITNGDKSGVYAKNGGMMPFLAMREKHFTGRGVKPPGAYSKLLDGLSYWSQSMEKWNRLSVMERSLRQQAKKAGITLEEAYKDRDMTMEAVNVSVNRLPYRQGGWLVKEIDKIFGPFISASYNASRVFLAGAKENPVDFAARIANVAVPTVGMTIAMALYAEEAKRDTPEWQHANGPVFTLFPDTLNFIDEEGNKRWINIRVPTDPTIAAVYNIFRGLTNKMMYESGMSDVEPNYQAIVDSITRSLPADTPLSPTLSAWFAYFKNIDVWRDQKVVPESFDWPRSGEEGQRDPKLGQLSKDIGKVTGLSPKRLKSASRQLGFQSNEFTWGMGKLYDAITSDIDPRLKKQHWAVVLSQTPGLKNLMSVTVPRAYRIDDRKEMKQEDVFNSMIRRETLNAKAEGYYWKDVGSEVDIETFIDGFEEKHIREGLRKRKDFIEKVARLPHRSSWSGSFHNTPEYKAKDFYKIWKVENSPEERLALERELDELLYSGYIGKGSEDRFFETLENLKYRQD